MDERIEQALKNDRVVDITTIGRRSGQPRRIEIWLHYEKDGVAYLTGSPGRRDWYANLRANPEFTVHVKRGARADLPAQAEAVLDESMRREILERVYGKDDQFEDRVKSSPLVQVKLGP